ncbi:MAG: metal-sensitive transcriptional regulator [Firmicutes bacterium]|jgi:DNA-binding FrmR family transcriptional regulator|nr:metal-sensitive transcriptional regulator [Bacillota bacterium]NLL87549.1 metal-sensitive transcriptional regulator [Bacillota bacterium]HKM17660.1 metal-sensitive transcriptional regulator [Limnochordia bacterium]
MGDNGGKKKLIQRLKRVEGQVRGIQRMIEHEQNCIEVLTQVAAARAALDRVGMIIFEEHSHTCLLRAIEEGQDDAIEELMQALKRFMQ